MTTRFLCTDPSWWGGTAPDCLLRYTVYSGQRFVAKPGMWDVVGHTLELGLDVGLVIAKESGDPAQYSDWATSDWMFTRVNWFIGNEMDNVGPSSWTMNPDDYRTLWNACKVLHGKRWVGGLASGDPSKAKLYYQPDADGMTAHIYTLNPVDAFNRVAQYRSAVNNKPWWVGETHPAGGARMADYTWPSGVRVNDFCFSNNMVDTMGLYV